jgi:hypothetical protein
MQTVTLGNVGSIPASPAKCSPEAFGGLSSKGQDTGFIELASTQSFRGETVGGRHGSYARLAPYLFESVMSDCARWTNER